MSVQYNPKEMKEKLTHLGEAREKLSQGVDVFGNMEKLKKTFDAMDPLMKSQQNYIKKFFANDSSKSESDKVGEFNRYINKMVEIVKQEIHEMVEVGDKFFHLHKREKKDSWEKIVQNLENKLNEARLRVIASGISNVGALFHFIFAILNLRDMLTKQMIKSLIYKKHLLWMDLKVPVDEYVSEMIKEISEQMKEHEENVNYTPTKIEFRVPRFEEEEGKWSILNDTSKTDPTGSQIKIFASFNKLYDEVLDTIENYSNLNDSPTVFEDITKNQITVKGLREKVQTLTINYKLLLEKYREANIKSDDKDDITILRQKLQQCESQLLLREKQLAQNKIESGDHNKKIKQYKDKVKELEDEITRLNSYELSKLKELEFIQRTTNNQFQKLKKEITGYAMMYKLESDSKRDVVKDKDSKAQQVQRLVDMLGREKNKVKKLQSEISRLNAIILQLGSKLPG